MSKFFIFFLSLLAYSCSSSINKSGLTDTDKFTMSFEGLHKEDIITIIGAPSSVDNLNNSFLYFSEVRKEKNIFDNKILSRNVYVLKFDNNNLFSKLESYSFNDKNKISFSNKTTDSEIIKTGYLEKIFGGVGKNKTLESTIPTAKVGN